MRTDEMLTVQAMHDDLMDQIASLLAALKVARQWMPERAIEPSSKAAADVALVDAALARAKAAAENS